MRTALDIANECDFGVWKLSQTLWLLPFRDTDVRPESLGLHANQVLIATGLQLRSESEPLAKAGSPPTGSIDPR